MDIHQISIFFSNLKIIKECNIDRLYFLKKNIINKIYLLAWQRDKLIKNIVVYNEVLISNYDKFDLYETILLNINQNASEPNFIFKNTKNRVFVITKYLTKIPKYQKEYLLENFKSSKNIKILSLENELFFEILPIIDKNKNQDILFLIELEEKRKQIKELIDESKFKRNKRN